MVAGRRGLAGVAVLQVNVPVIKRYEHVHVRIQYPTQVERIATNLTPSVQIAQVNSASTWLVFLEVTRIFRKRELNK